MITGMKVPYITVQVFSLSTMFKFWCHCHNFRPLSFENKYYGNEMPGEKAHNSMFSMKASLKSPCPGHFSCSNGI
ncbi:hypothetical protein CEXT_735021 [Caerostris extrusa]|uniref:Uncharacterized protein n=1 Tax=Caerostris extrusa TaxID=172846 RepID=A0AAV4MLW1_CAEEX|nr:hypothetical protein CEXT_735021 [Caerostris extrusa]